MQMAMVFLMVVTVMGMIVLQVLYKIVILLMVNAGLKYG